MVTGEHLIGGILGRGAGIIRNCTSDASVTVYADPDVIADRYENINATAGGIAGLFSGDVEDEVGGTDYETSARNFAFGAVVENCVFSGSVVCVDDNTSNITSVGGLVGNGVCVIRDSVFRGKLNGGADEIGGILGRASYYFNADGTEVSLIRNCQVTQPEGSTLHITIKDSESFGGVLGGDTTGSTAYIYHTDINCDILIDGRPGKVGGLTACSSYAEHCDVNGDISIYSADTVSVGGFGGWIFGSFADCHINGKITVTAPEEVVENEGEENETSYSSTVGLIATGSNYEGNATGHYYQSGLGPEGEMTWNGAPVTEMRSVEEDEWTFHTFEEDGLKVNFFVQGGYYDSGETFPLNGAKITVGNVTGYTDSTGMATLELEESAFQSAVEVRIQREGYDDFVDLHAFATNQDYSATLWKLDPGKIFITGGTVQLTEYVTRDIFGTAKTIILQEDELAYPISVTINWNGHEPDKVCLFGEESGKRVDLTINGNVASGNVVFGGTQNTFLPDEMIRVYATTKNTEEFGVINAVRLTSIKVKPLDVNINVTDPGGATVSDEEDPDKFFLQGSKVKLDLGDLAGCASSVTLKNGIITVSFGKKDGEKKKGDLFTLDDAYSKDEVSVTGSISIPYQALLTNPEEAEWSGEIKVGLNNTTGFSDNAADAMKDMIQGVENDMPIHEDIWDFTVAGVPCYVKASVGVYAGATLKAFGSAEKVSVTGQLNGGATGKVGGGVGGAIGEDVIKYKDHAAIEVMAGLYGSVSGDFAVSMEAIPRGDYDLETKFDMTPTVSGEVGGEVIVHVFMLELENKLKLGSFTWTDEGIEWFLAGEEGEVKALSLGDTSEEWGLLGRDYREKLSLLAETNPNVLKENVIGSSQTAVDASFFYVDEDPSVPVEQQYNALRLYVLDRYGYATMVDKADDNTSDHSPYAYSYTDTNWNTVQGVTWVDVKEQSEADLAKFLQDGRIAFSAYDYDVEKYGDKVIVASAGENNRVYHPVLGASCIAWLESPIQSENGSLLLMPDSVKLWMSTTSDGGATWSTPVCVKQLEGETISEIITVTTSAITYRAGDTLYTINTSDGSVKDTVTDRALYGVRNTLSGWQSDEGLELQYKAGTAVSRKTFALSSELTQAPIFTEDSDGCYFVTGNQIWKTSFTWKNKAWSTPVQVAETKGAIRELREKDGMLFYLADDGEGGTDLYRHSEQRQYPIHSIRQENGMIVVEASGSVWAYDGSKTYSPTRTDKTFYYFPLSELPVGELYFSTESHKRAYTIREAKAEVLLTEADFEEDGTLRARLISNTALGEDIQFTLSAYGTETVVDSWTGDERYDQNMFYETVYDGNELEDGAYVLTAAYGTVQSSILVGKGDPLAEEETVEVGTPVTGDGETTIRLMDSGKQLSGSVLVLAARYEKGQMKESTFGTAEGGEGIWDLILPEQVTEGWKLFLLDSTTKAPLCDPIVVQ